MTKITSTTNFKSGDAIDSNKFFPMKENKMTTPILMKLLATKSVASNFLGFSKREVIILVFVGFARVHSSISLGVKEK